MIITIFLQHINFPMLKHSFQFFLLHRKKVFYNLEKSRQGEQFFSYIKNNFGGEADDDAAHKRAKATLLLDTLESSTKKDPTKSRAIYEAKHMLFAANMPTKYVLEYAVTMGM